MLFISNLWKTTLYGKQKINQATDKDIMRNSNQSKVGGLDINTKIKFKLKEVS